MDIRELRYFAQVAKDGNYSVAANKLNITQPALSKVIKKLEDEVGFPLFYTFQRRQRLTDDGEFLLEKVVRVINEYDSIIESTAMSKSIYQGQIFLGIPPVAGTCYFSEILASFPEEYPGIKISITEEGTEKIQKDVSNGLLDIGCVSAPVSDELFDHTLFVHDPFCLIVNAQHPLVGKSSIKFEDLKNESFILSGSDFSLSYTVRAACRDAGFEPNVTMTSSRWDFIVQLVQLNYGISIQPRSVFDRFYFPDIKILEIDAPFMNHSLELISKKGMHVTRSTNCFIAHVMKYVQDGVFNFSLQKPIIYRK